MWVLAKLAIHNSLTYGAFFFLFCRLSFGFFTIPYNTLRYFSEKGKEVAVLFSSCFHDVDPGLKTLRRPNARFKTQTKKLRSVIHTHDSQQRFASVLVFLPTQRAVFFRVFSKVFAVLAARLPQAFPVTIRSLF